MIIRYTAKAVAVALCFTVSVPVWAQTPGSPNSQAPASTKQDQTPQVSYRLPGLTGAYKAGSVSSTGFGNSPRVQSLVRAGNIYLSLQDAIALSLENNLDIELERYGIALAATDTLRARGGAFLRGLPLTVNETPAGIGGPGSPLITTAATGVTPQTSIPVNVTDTQLIQEGQGNLGVVGTFPFAAGPPIPQFDPSITGQLLAQHQTLPENNLLTTGTPTLTQNILSANINYIQGFSPGTQVNAGVQTASYNTNSQRTLYNPYYPNTLGITITQPLLRGFGVEMNRRYITIAKNSEKITDYIFRQQVISTVSGVIRLYNDLVSLNEDFRVKQQTLTTAERLVEDNRSKVEQGTLAPIELTRALAQATASRQDLINAEGYVRQQELILKNVLFRSGVSDPSIHELRIVPTDPIQVENVPDTPAQQLAQQALDNRPEYQAARLQVTNAAVNLKGTKNSLLPQVDLVANAQNNGLSGPFSPNFVSSGTATVPNPVPNVGGYGTSWEQVLARDNPTYSIGVNLTLPIRNRIAQGDVARDELQVRQTEVRVKQLENQIRLEVEDAVIALQRTRSALDAAAETRKLQEESLSIEQEKFNVGLSTNFLVIQYQSYLAQARSTEVAARSAYSKAKVQLERAIGRTLENNNVQIDEAMRGLVMKPPTPLPPPPPPAP